MKFLGQYMQIKKRNMKIAWKKAKMSKTCYLFLLPYAIVFTAFYILPVCMSIFYSFTYYNVLEPARFVGLDNYIKLFLSDDVFLIAIKNTFLLAAITGPLGYIMAFIFAWFINELPRYIRAFAVCVFYAPTISGQAYMVWSILFSGDAYGYVNAFFIKLGILNEPALWLTDVKYMMNVVIVIVLWMSLGAVMAITQSFGVADVTMALCGFPSTDYAARTVVTHLIDYGTTRFEMGYASAIATVLFVVMIVCNRAIQALLSKVGT